MVFEFSDGEHCDCEDGDDCESYDFTVEARNTSGADRPVYYKCPEFPNCKVCTPFMIRLNTPDDMEHFMKYHEHEWHANL